MDDPRIAELVAMVPDEELRSAILAAFQKASGVPPLGVIQLKSAIDEYITDRILAGKAADIYKARLRWCLRWMAMALPDGKETLEQEDFLAFEVWLRSASSSRQGQSVGYALRSEVLKRLRGALRWAAAEGHLPHDYSEWVPQAGQEEKADASISAVVAANLTLEIPESGADRAIGQTAISTANTRVWLEMFCLSKESAGLSRKTISWYRTSLEVYFSWLDRHNGLGPMDAVALEMYLKDQRTLFTKATVHGKYRAICAFTNWCVKRRYITTAESPIPLIEKPKLPKHRMKFVTKAEFDHLYASIRGDKWATWRDRLLLTILFFSGLRAREVLNLRVEDIEREVGVIHVKSGKGDKDRVVPFAPEVPALLDAYLAKRPPWPQTGTLFVSDNGVGGIRGPMQYMGFKELMRRRCRIARMPNLNCHAFRHGFAMWALNNGVPMSALSAMMGHTSVVVTEAAYARWLTSAIRREYTMAFDRFAAGDGTSA